MLRDCQKLCCTPHPLFADGALVAMTGRLAVAAAGLTVTRKELKKANTTAAKLQRKGRKTPNNLKTAYVDQAAQVCGWHPPHTHSLQPRMSPKKRGAAKLSV